METLTLLDMRREFGCDRILARFLEQDLKFESFGNLGLIYTLIDTSFFAGLRPAQKLPHPMIP